MTYAFGQRLPDGALNRYGEFELFGGVADDESDKEPGNTRTRLEEMVVARDGEGKAEVWGGRVVPRSALEVERRGPIVMGQPHVAGQALPGVGAAEGASSAGEPPLPPPTNRPRRRSSVSRSITNNGTTFVSARPRRPSATSGNAPLTAPAIALGWALPGPGGNESSSSITSAQTTSADESHAEARGQAMMGGTVGEGEAMMLDN